MRSMLLIVSLLADPIPDNIREYFDYGEQQREAAAKRITDQQAALETKIKFETERVRLGKLKAQNRECTEQLEALSKASFTPSLRGYPRPKKGTVGDLSGAVVIAVVDEQTVLARTSRGSVLFTGIPTKELRIRKPFATTGAWLVTNESIDDKELLTLSSPTTSNPITVAPVPPAELIRHRTAYDAARKQR